MPEYDRKTIEEFARLMDDLSLTEIEYGTGDWHIRLSKAATGVQTVATVSATPAQPVQKKDSRIGG